MQEKLGKDEDGAGRRPVRNPGARTETLETANVVEG